MLDIFQWFRLGAKVLQYNFKGGNVKKLAVLLVVVLASAFLTSCDFNRSRTVTFFADAGTETVLGNYVASGAFASFSGEPSPWSVDVSAEKNDYVLLTVAIESGSGSLTARVYVDDVLFNQANGTDAAIVQVGGFIP
jgi:hypothetical protein